MYCGTEGGNVKGNDRPDTWARGIINVTRLIDPVIRFLRVETARGAVFLVVTVAGPIPRK